MIPPADRGGIRPGPVPVADDGAVGGIGRDTSSGPWVVTLVVDLPVTKLDALDVIAFVADAVVDHAGTAFPRVGLAPGVWAEVQIPRFADPPPLAIDVCSEVSRDHAATHAARLAAALERVGWHIRSPRDGER